MEAELPTLQKVAAVLSEAKLPAYKALGQELIRWLEVDWPKTVEATGQLVPDARQWRAVEGYIESLIVMQKELKRTKKSDVRRMIQLQNSILTLSKSIAAAVEAEREQEP